MRFGGIVLCGGASKRMGSPKAWLSFGSETLVARVVRTLSDVVQPVVVVAAVEQPLPQFPKDVVVAYDRTPDCGPLEGIAAGLDAIADRTDAAFVCGCDAALLCEEVVRHLCRLLGEFDGVVPVIEGHRQTLAAVYHSRVLRTIESLLAAGERKTYRLLDRISTRFVQENELLAVDSGLKSFRTMNTPQEYLAALALAGFTPPADAQLQRLFGV